MNSITRRQFNRAALGITLAIASGFSTERINASSESAPDPILPEDLEKKAADDWILEWKNKATIDKDLQGPLDLRRFEDPTYILLNSIKWSQKSKSNCCIAPVIVPKGFVTDFASIPRVFWSLFKPDGNYAYAAVIHDYLYWQQDRPKTEADFIFRSAMDDLNINDSQAFILYKAVDTFGSSAWKSNAELKKTGEQRVLKKFPERPEITWEEWKKKTDVY